MPTTVPILQVLVIAAIAASLSGCGTIKTRSGTDQLLMSDAVDRSIYQMDFSALTGSTVFLDTKYVRQVRGVGFVNSDYIIAALRERMMTSGCLLEERRDDAEFVVEVRVGALGADGHEITYGIPASQTLNSAANLVASSPVMPSIPEISLAKRDERRAEVKLGLFAYHRETRTPVGQPDVVKGTSMAKATWFLGAGPFEQGSIYESVQLAGQPISEITEQVATIEGAGFGILRLPPVRFPGVVNWLHGLPAHTPQVEPVVAVVDHEEPVTAANPDPVQPAVVTTPTIETSDPPTPTDAPSAEQIAVDEGSPELPAPDATVPEPTTPDPTAVAEGVPVLTEPVQAEPAPIEATPIEVTQPLVAETSPSESPADAPGVTQVTAVEPLGSPDTATIEPANQDAVTPAIYAASAAE